MFHCLERYNHVHPVCHMEAIRRRFYQLFDLHGNMRVYIKAIYPIWLDRVRALHCSVNGLSVFNLPHSTHQIYICIPCYCISLLTVLCPNVFHVRSGRTGRGKGLPLWPMVVWCQLCRLRGKVSFWVVVVMAFCNRPTEGRNMSFQDDCE